jgi:hypothetical protein
MVANKVSRKVVKQTVMTTVALLSHTHIHIYTLNHNHTHRHACTHTRARTRGTHLHTHTHTSRKVARGIAHSGSVCVVCVGGVWVVCIVCSVRKH